MDAVTQIDGLGHRFCDAPQERAGRHLLFFDAFTRLPEPFSYSSNDFPINVINIQLMCDYLPDFG